MSACKENSIKLCGSKNCAICYARSFASNEKAKCWDYNKNKTNPWEHFRSEAKYTDPVTKVRDYSFYWFICDNDECKHSFKASLDKISGTKNVGTRMSKKPDNPVKEGDKKKKIKKDPSKGTWCPYCAKFPKLLCDDVNCKPCFDKSFQSVDCDMLRKYSDKNDKTPRQVFKTSNDKYIFYCEDCKHEFTSKLSNITALERECRYCAHQELCDDTECDRCYNNSLASVAGINDMWSKKNKLQPRKHFKNTHTQKITIKCLECKHEYITSPRAVTRGDQCKHCRKHNKKLCSDKNCKNGCYENSFASHPKSKHWCDEDNGDITPKDVLKGSDSKYWFKCEECDNKFQTSMYHVTGNNRWCPYCYNKTEKKLQKWLKNKYGDEFKRSVRYTWCKNPSTKKYLPFDFANENMKLIIELDGGQHFKQVSNWESPKEIQRKDCYKMFLANENGYTVIRLLQEDVYSDKNDWENKLTNLIKKYEKPSRMFITENEEIYKYYKQLVRIKVKKPKKIIDLD